MKITTSTIAFAFALLPVVLGAQVNSELLDINAITTNVASDGNLDETRTTDSGKYLSFATQLWLSAEDASSSLCVAAQSFRQAGVDFVPGPISNNGNASIIYDKVWKMNKTMVDSFSAGLFFGIVPPAIANWPAHGDPTQGESFYLAPFVDVNGNGYYNPLVDGDYPCIQGDQAIFFVFNDDVIHTNTGGASLGVEILGMAYAYSHESFLDSVQFVQYTIRPKKKALYNFYASAFSDLDLGNGMDDLIGTFVDQNAVVVYNSTNDDQGPFGFGLNPPSAGMVVLSGLPTSSADGLDNDKDGCVDGVLDKNGNCQPINASTNIVESWRLSNLIYGNNTTDPYSGNPQTAIQFRNYMHGFWKNADTLFVETPSGFMNNGNGDGIILNGGGIPARYAYPGNSYDTAGAFFPTAPTNWFESPNNASDKRVVAGLGNIDVLNVGDEAQIKLALFMARDASTINSYDAAHAMAVKINRYQETLPNCSGSALISVVEEDKLENLEIFPNPTQNWLSISAPNAKTKQGEIFSYDGRKVLEFKLDEHGSKALDVSALRAGFYVLRIENQSMRFIVSR